MKIDGQTYSENEWKFKRLEEIGSYQDAMLHHSATGHQVDIDGMAHHNVCRTCKRVTYDKHAKTEDTQQEVPALVYDQPISDPPTTSEIIGGIQEQVEAAPNWIWRKAFQALLEEREQLLRSKADLEVTNGQLIQLADSQRITMQKARDRIGELEPHEAKVKAYRAVLDGRHSAECKTKAEGVTALPCMACHAIRLGEQMAEEAGSDGA